MKQQVLVKKKTGRPLEYTKEVGDKICELIAGGLSLRRVCERADMPHRPTVHHWRMVLPEFASQYARAREALYEHWEDEILTISDDGTNDWMERELGEGRVIQIPDHEHIARSRLRVDSRKWLMSKLAPKKYGDRVMVEGDENPNPRSVTIINQTANVVINASQTDAARAYQKLLTG